MLIVEIKSGYAPLGFGKKFICDGCNVKDGHEHRCHKNEAEFNGAPVDVVQFESEASGAQSGNETLTISKVKTLDWFHQACECICNDPDIERDRQNWEKAGKPDWWVFKNSVLPTEEPLIIPLLCDGCNNLLCDGCNNLPENEHRCCSEFGSETSSMFPLRTCECQYCKEQTETHQ